MSGLFDPLNLVLAAIALMVIWRLRSVLGQRTGQERPPTDPYASSRKANGNASPDAGNGKILEFPSGKEDPAKNIDVDSEPKTPIWANFAKAESPAAAGFEKLAQADPNFLPKTFLEGAKLAYEMIVEAFAKGDKRPLKIFCHERYLMASRRQLIAAASLAKSSIFNSWDLKRWSLPPWPWLKNAPASVSDLPVR